MSQNWQTIETREQTLAKINFRLPELTDKELRLVSAFIRGIRKAATA